jgi:hypothetical protein
MRKKKKVRFIKHAKERLRERCTSIISHIRIAEAIRKGECHSVKKLTNTRSLYYLKIDNTPIKVIYQKKEAKIITLLPLNYEYETEFFEINENGNLYRIKLFPDCYIETHNPSMMTIFEKFTSETNEWLIYNKRNETFLNIFKNTWNEYFENGKNKSKTENQETCISQIS